MKKKQKQNYLINTRTPWDEPPRARHQLANALAKKNQVFFVAANKKGIPRVEIKEQNENLCVIQPYWYTDYRIRFRFPLINELYQIWLFKGLRKNFQKDIRVINFDHTSHLISYFFHNSIYYCSDYIKGIKTGRFWLINQYHAYCEKKIAQNAVFCVSVSKFLQNEISKFNSNSFLVLLGAPKINGKFNDSNFINIKKQASLIYIGWLSEIRVDWLIKLAELKTFNIKLVGPYRTNDIKKYSKFNNIEIIGPLKYDSLYHEISKSDVSIAPYKPDVHVEQVYSMTNKFWLCLALGKPIVTCNMRNIIPLPSHFVYRSGNFNEFVSNIEIAILNNDIHIENERREFAKKNTWDSRVEELMKIYEVYDRNI